MSTTVRYIVKCPADADTITLAELRKFVQQIMKADMPDSTPIQANLWPRFKAPGDIRELVVDALSPDDSDPL